MLCRQFLEKGEKSRRISVLGSHSVTPRTLRLTKYGTIHLAALCATLEAALEALNCACARSDDFVCIHPWLRAIDVGERPIHFAYNAITSGAAIAYAAMAGSIC